MSQKIISHSIILQGKESMLPDLQRKSQIVALSLDQFKDIKKESIAIMSKFIKGNLKEQRKIMNKDIIELMFAFCDIIEKINHDRNIMNVVLTSLDGVLSDDKTAIYALLEIQKSQFPQFALLEVLRKIINLKDNDLINYDASLHIIAVLIPGMKQPYKKQQSESYEFLIHEIKLNFHNIRRSILRGNEKFSGLSISASLAIILQDSHILNSFVHNDGIKIILSTMKLHYNELQTIYYSTILLWIVSFEKNFLNYFEDPEVYNVSFRLELSEL